MISQAQTSPRSMVGDCKIQTWQMSRSLMSMSYTCSILLTSLRDLPRSKAKTGVENCWNMLIDLLRLASAPGLLMALQNLAQLTPSEQILCYKRWTLANTTFAHRQAMVRTYQEPCVLLILPVRLESKGFSVSKIVFLKKVWKSRISRLCFFSLQCFHFVSWHCSEVYSIELITNGLIELDRTNKTCMDDSDDSWYRI